MADIIDITTERLWECAHCAGLLWFIHEGWLECQACGEYDSRHIKKIMEEELGNEL